MSGVGPVLRGTDARCEIGLCLRRQAEEIEKMKKNINFKQEKWITRFDKMTERTIFFYATLVMLVVGVIYKFQGLW